MDKLFSQENLQTSLQQKNLSQKILNKKKQSFGSNAYQQSLSDFKE